VVGILRKHLNDAEMTYWRHFIIAIGFSVTCATAAVTLFIHALVPFLFVSTGSTMIKNIKNKMISGHVE